MATDHLPPELRGVITYRQLDHWCRRGYLRPEAGEGYGKPRSWPEGEVRIAKRMAGLVSVGFTVLRAAALARHAEAHPELMAWSWEPWDVPGELVAVSVRFPHPEREEMSRAAPA